ncbi:hypothetical protein GALMADRAFT_266533 [Galerina marginata CBS 339.88]|uniref:Uncharacterized protein n=1 Tax=Galerina marginata (strain CBS 339.88) TaxID=685588 RepID=A0A067T6N4_GALM3|nr:hypothetical protein GALMADRAFT_266533 [Galerina marginata CBS 339.88]
MHLHNYGLSFLFFLLSTQDVLGAPVILLEGEILTKRLEDEANALWSRMSVDINRRSPAKPGSPFQYRPTPPKPQVAPGSKPTGSPFQNRPSSGTTTHGGPKPGNPFQNRPPSTPKPQGPAGPKPTGNPFQHRPSPGMTTPRGPKSGSPFQNRPSLIPKPRTSGPKGRNSFQNRPLYQLTTARGQSKPIGRNPFRNRLLTGSVRGSQPTVPIQEQFVSASNTTYSRSSSQLSFQV